MDNKKDLKEQTRITVYLSRKLRQDFKLKTTANYTSMNEVLTDFIREYCNEVPNPVGRRKKKG